MQGEHAKEQGGLLSFSALACRHVPKISPCILKKKKKKKKTEKKPPMLAIKSGEEILWWCHSNLTKLCIVPLSLGINFYKKNFEAFISEMVKKISSQKEFTLVTPNLPQPWLFQISPNPHPIIMDTNTTVRISFINFHKFLEL